MYLSDFAFACYVYGNLESDDTTYEDFRKSINNKLDLENGDHRNNLLEWLRKWGCRQFHVSQNDLSSNEILNWHNANNKKISILNKDLYYLNGSEILVLGDLYSSLKEKKASVNKIGVTSRVGPTGAAKILFALMPETAPPWDNPIREHFRFDETKESYIKYLAKVKDVLLEAEEECEKKNIPFRDLPKVFGRQNSTLAKLVDEYFWITITYKCIPPSTELLSKWHNWSKKYD